MIILIETFLGLSHASKRKRISWLAKKNFKALRMEANIKQAGDMTTSNQSIEDHFSCL